jgi:hypothetical protein
MATPTMTQVLIDKGHEMQEEYENLLRKRAANRRSLKDLAEQELLNDDELAAVEELYPPRERKTEEERLAEAEDKAAKLREQIAADAE